MRFLIVKTSAIGDVIQALCVLDYLKELFPFSEVDWVVERASYNLIKAHPSIRKAILFDFKTWWRNVFNFKRISPSLREIRSCFYDVIFDLQGNTKSSLITFLAKGRDKVGFLKPKEFPNLLVTNIKKNVPQDINMRLQYLRLIQDYYQDKRDFKFKEVFFNTKVKDFAFKGLKVMICPFASFKNKEIGKEFLFSFLKKIKDSLNPHFFFIFSDERQEKIAQELKKIFWESASLLGKMDLVVLQSIMKKMDVIIASDSSLLHLCSTTSTPSFGIFGPTSPAFFNPLGKRHGAFQGRCDKGISFRKKCGHLRTCQSPACLRDLSSSEVFESFMKWWSFINENISKTLV